MGVRVLIITIQGTEKLSDPKGKAAHSASKSVEGFAKQDLPILLTDKEHRERARLPLLFGTGQPDPPIPPPHGALPP